MLNFPDLTGRRWLIARKRAGRIALYITIALVCLVIVFPLYWLVINALIPGREVFAIRPHSSRNHPPRRLQRDY